MCRRGDSGGGCGSVIESFCSDQSVAADAEIVTLDLTYSKSTDVLECVLSSESLSDLAMETFRKRVPR